MPIKRGKKEVAFSLFSILIVLILDQSLKSFIRLNFLVGESMPIIKNILHVTFVRNTGAAFGLFKNSAPFFIIVSMAAIMVMLYLLLKSVTKGEFLKNFIFNFSLILIISGAFGNLIDRIRFGYVIDFIDVRIWPVFNIADSSITIGSLILILSFMRQKAQSAR